MNGRDGKERAGVGECCALLRPGQQLPLASIGALRAECAKAGVLQGGEVHTYLPVQYFIPWGLYYWQCMPALASNKDILSIFVG